jgi:hypothetical protein
LDDLARRAAEDIRTRAEAGPSKDFAEWRRRRGVRSVLSVVAGGLAVVFAISLGAAIGEDDPDLAIDDTLPPEVVTTTTLPVTSSTAPPDGPAVPTGILGAGWERLDYGPLTGGRYRMATAWTGDHLFLFGGHLLESQEAPPASEFMQDGYLYEPATDTWTPTGRPPGLCQLGLTRAISLGDGVLVHGSVSIGGGFTCARAAFYDIETGTWSTVENELFANVSSLSPLADTGEMLVAPGAGLAWDHRSDEVIEIPRLPSDAAGDPPSSAKAHWTGTDVIVVGSGPTYSWVPGDDAWTEVGQAHSRGVDSAMTDVGLLVVDFGAISGAPAIAAGSTGEWQTVPDLPTAAHFCQPEVVAVAETVALRTCSAILLWDDARFMWVPIQLEDVIGADLGALIDVGGRLYSVGRSLRVLDTELRSGDAVSVPRTIPVGQVMLDIPDDAELVGSYREVREPGGQTPGVKTVGVRFIIPDGSSCSVSWTYDGRPTELGDFDVELDMVEPVVLARPGRSSVSATRYRSSTNAAAALAVFLVDGAAVVRCDGPDAAAVSDAATEFAVGLWSPWETEPAELEEASLIVTPQAGTSGTVVTLHATNFPSGWSEWWLIDENGNAVAEIPSDFFPHDNSDFTLSIGIDVLGTAGLTTVQIPPGTYRFAIDGQIVPGASFTKTEARYPLKIGFQSHPFGGIYELSIENVGNAPIYLSDWWIVDEIPNGIELLLPRSTLDPDGQFFIEAGETLWIHIDQVAGCEPGELLEQARYSLTYCAEPPAASAEGDSLALRTVSGGDLVERLFVGKPCDAGSDDPYCGYATFRDADNRITFRIPDDAGLEPEFGRWHIADFRLTPNLVSPTEILSLGTYPLRQGGDTCAQIPENALEDLGSLDAFISIQRRAGAARDAFSPRPDAFTYEWFDEQAGSGFWDCLDDRPDRDEMFLRWGSFSDGDALYYVIVALGEDAHQTIRAEQVLRILNSLEFDA